MIIQKMYLVKKKNKVYTKSNLDKAFIYFWKDEKFGFPPNNPSVNSGGTLHTMSMTEGHRNNNSKVCR